MPPNNPSTTFLRWSLKKKPASNKERGPWILYRVDPLAPRDRTKNSPPETFADATLMMATVRHEILSKRIAGIPARLHHYWVSLLVGGGEFNSDILGLLKEWDSQLEPSSSNASKKPKHQAMPAKRKQVEDNLLYLRNTYDCLERLCHDLKWSEARKNNERSIAIDESYKVKPSPSIVVAIAPEALGVVSVESAPSVSGCAAPES